MSFDRNLAQRAIDWFPRYLRHTKGRWRGAPFELLPWQKEIIGKLFGTVRKDGYRQYRTVYVEVPKKNGKSELAAGIALFLLFADHEPGAEIYSAAADRDQAAIVYGVAAEMVRLSPRNTLAKRCKIIDSTKRIIHNKGSFYRVLSADAHTKHGFNSHGIIFDELHAQPNRNLWDVLTEGAGDARTQPVVFAITTAGWNRNSICWEIHDYACKVRDGIIEDPSFLPVIFGAEEQDDWTSEATWKKCNPSIGVTITVDRIRQACKRAQEVPAVENTFRRLRLNQWVKQESRYLPMDKWRACGGIVDKDKLKGLECFGGLDLASTTDIAAFAAAFRPGIDGRIPILCRFWIPEESMELRSRRDKVPYDLWVKQEYITATPGNVIDYDFIEADLIKFSKEYFLSELAYDRWGAIQVSQHLTAEGFTMIDFGQGYKSMGPPTKELLKLVLGKELAHGENPVLTWMADNVVVTKDPTEALKPDKAKSTERIDGIVALIMAIDRLIRNLQGSGTFVNDPTPKPAAAGMRDMEF